MSSWRQLVGAPDATAGGRVSEARKKKELAHLEQLEGKRAELIKPYRVMMPGCPLLVAAKAALLHHHYDLNLLPKVEEKNKKLQQLRTKSTNNVTAQAEPTLELEHKRLHSEKVDHAVCSPDEVWSELNPAGVPPGLWHDPPLVERELPSGTTAEVSRPDAELMQLARVDALGKFMRLDPEADEEHRGPWDYVWDDWFDPERTLDLYAQSNSEGGGDPPQPQPALDENTRKRGRTYWWRTIAFEGGVGATPLHQCILKSPESLLAARYILHRWPRMLSEKYQLGPQKLVDPDPADDPGMYAGESVLHQCIVKEERALLLFAEKAQNVHNGLGQLRKLANERDYSHVALQPEGRLVERAKALVEHSLHGRGKVAPADELETVEAAAAEAAACVRQRAKDAEPAQVSLPLSLATFFSKGNSCYYGGYPLSFAAATGGPLWYFMYLVNRLHAKLDKQDQHGNTALHIAVIHGKSESYRYVRALALCMDCKLEDVQNGVEDIDDITERLTPLQLAAKLGKKVPQGADDAGSDSDDDDDVDVTGGDVVDPMMVELKRRLGFMRRKEAQKVHPLKKPEIEDEPEEAVYMFNFILKLQQQTRWSFGNVSSVKFCMDQLFVPNDSSKEHVGLCATVGTSALLLVCRNKRFDLLCPHGSLEFVSASVQQAAGRDFALEKYFPVDSDINANFRLPSLPGKITPPIESVMLLVLAESAWKSFGRRLLLVEFCCGYAPYLALITYNLWDRARQQNSNIHDPYSTAGYAIDGVLLGQSCWVLLYYQWRKLGDTPRAVWEYWRVMSSMEAAFFVILIALNSLVASSSVIRIIVRWSTGSGMTLSTFSVEQPPDLELLSVAAALGYFNLLYYLRCIYKFGPLAITIVQVLVKDVFEMLTIYGTIMVGFALAFHLLMSPTACSDADVALGYCDPSDGAHTDAAAFYGIPHALLTTGLMTVGDGFHTDSFALERAEWVGRILHITWIILANVLIFNVLIALLNNTFSEVFDEVQQKHVFQRTQVVLQLESIFRNHWLLKHLLPFGSLKNDAGYPFMDKDTSGSWSMLVERTGRQDGDDALLEALGQNALDVETQTWNEDKAYGKSLKKSSSGNEAPEPLELLKQGTALQNALDSFLANAGGKLGPGDTLLMHHLQNDFISGSMKVKGATHAGKFDLDGKNGGDLVCFCAELLKVFSNAGALVVISQDYHPHDHISFASTHGAPPACKLHKSPPETVDLWYGPQELWPDHCVRGTKGASLPDEVRTAVPWTQRLLVARNGFRQNVDSYSAFFDNDKASRTGLMKEVADEWREWRKRRDKEAAKEAQNAEASGEASANGKPGCISGSGFFACMEKVLEQEKAEAPEPPRGPRRRLFIVGLAYDIGVRYTAEEAAVLYTRPRTGDAKAAMLHVDKSLKDAMWDEVYVIENGTRLLQADAVGTPDAAAELTRQPSSPPSVGRTTSISRKAPEGQPLLQRVRRHLQTAGVKILKFNLDASDPHNPSGTMEQLELVKAQPPGPGQAPSAPAAGTAMPPQPPNAPPLSSPNGGALPSGAGNGLVAGPHLGSSRSAAPAPALQPQPPAMPRSAPRSRSNDGAVPSVADDAPPAQGADFGSPARVYRNPEFV